MEAMRRTMVGAIIAGIALALVITACGSTGHGTTTAIRGPLPASIVINAVVSGSGEGWIVTDDAHLWRVEPDGTAASYPAPELARLGAISATNFKGMVMVGGVRCKTNATRDDCPEVIGEVIAYKDGAKAWSAVVWKRAGPYERSDGFAIVGPYKDALLLETDSGMVTVSADGSVVFRAPQATGEACVIDGDLYAYHSTMDTSSGIIDFSVPRAIVIQALRAGSWVEVPGSAHAEPLSGGCSVNAFQLDGRNGIAEARWTPASGWQPASSPTTAMDADVGAVTASTHRRFFLTTDGRLGRDQGGSFGLAGLAFDTQRAPTTLPPMLAVDDSGGSVFACVTFSRSAPVCKVGSK